MGANKNRKKTSTVARNDYTRLEAKNKKSTNHARQNSLTWIQINEAAVDTSSQALGHF
jgi:hypothetical protein